MLMRMILVLTALLLLPCRSARVETSERRGNCYESSNGLVNTQGWGCEVYYHTEGMCGKYDGNGFNSMEMCCACNGGYWPEADTNQEKHGEQDSCHGFTCDEWIEKNPAYTCSYLTDAFGCDCSTSSCSTHCPATCGGFRCDDWIDSDHAYSCGLLQHSYGCDCAGCECKTHVAALTDGYSLLENADTGNSGDCMNHCVDCDHTWLPHQVHSIEGCRTLCDENFNKEGIDQWCYAYSWDETWKACRLYHEAPDGPSADSGTVCYVKEQAYPAEHSAYESREGNLIIDKETMQEMNTQMVMTTMQPPAKTAKKAKEVGKHQPKQELGLVNDKLWAHYMMKADLTFRITNTFSEPSACVQSSAACISNKAFDHSDVLTQTKTGGAYSRRTVVFGGGNFGPFQKYSLFKPNAMNIHTTWRVADAADDAIIHFTIQKIKGGVDCAFLGFNCKNAWNVYRGLTRGNTIVYYAIESTNQFRIYRNRAAFETSTNNWCATVASILPTEQNGQSVLSITVKPGEDTALLMLAAWAMYKSGDTNQFATKAS